jgi:hypothetical protein
MRISNLVKNFNCSRKTFISPAHECDAHTSSSKLKSLVFVNFSECGKKVFEVGKLHIFG